VVDGVLVGVVGFVVGVVDGVLVGVAGLFLFFLGTVSVVAVMSLPNCNCLTALLLFFATA
jgi:hypothetical protein